MPAEGEKNRVTFLKRKTNALFSRLQRLQTSLSIETLSGYDEFTLTVRLEQIDELQSAFNVLHTELEELDFDEIGSEMSESFYEFIVEFKARVRAEIAKRNVHFAPHSTLAEGIVPHQCSGPQTQPRPRPMPLPPVQLPTFGGGYANWADFHSVFTSIIDSHPDLSNVEKFQHLRLVQRAHLWEDLQSLKTLGRVSSSSPISSLSSFLDQFGLLRVGGRLRNSSLDFDGRHPNNCHISAVINSRPLVPISENPADLDVLTPAHFLNGGPPSSFDEPDITGLNYNRLDSWQRISFLQHIFWSRWKEEYLTLLQQRSKWRTPKPGAAVDNVVLVKDENLPPMRWPLARAMQLIPGRDGVARVAELRTASGVIRRAVNKLCLLPLEDFVGTQASNGGRMLGHAAAKTVQ